MSGFAKPSGVIGSPIDPNSPSGILIDPTTEIGGSPILNDVIKGDGFGGWTIGSAISAGGGLVYKGTWNASTNTPTLPIGSEVNGDYYIVSVAGVTNLDGITDWGVGDWAIYNGTVFQKINNSDVVTTRISVGRNNPNATNIWLRDANGLPMNLSPVRLPFASRLIAMSAVGNAAQTWDAEVWSGAAVRAGGVPANGGEDAQLSVVANTGVTTTALSIAYPADAEIGVFLRGVSIDYPRVDLYLLRTI